MQFLTSKQALNLAERGKLDMRKTAIASDNPEMWLKLTTLFPDTAQVSREQFDRAEPKARARALKFVNAAKKSQLARVIRLTTVGGMNVVSSDFYRKLLELEVLLQLNVHETTYAVISCPSVAHAYCSEKNIPLSLRWKIKLAIAFTRNISKAVLRTLYSSFRLVANKLTVKVSDTRVEQSREYILIRTWVTKGCFAKKGDSYDFLDRNFGALTQRLKSQGNDVLALPMFFNLGQSKRSAFEKFRRSNSIALNYFKYSSWRDVFATVAFAFAELRGCFISFGQTDKEMNWLFRISHSRQAASPAHLELHFSARSVTYLKSRGVKIRSIAYPFENNPSEQMLLEQIHDEAITSIGFQHSPWYQEQYSMQYQFVHEQGGRFPSQIFASNESGLKALQKSGWPQSGLRRGPNLRFARNQWPEEAPLTRDGKFKLGVVLSYDDKSARILLGSLRTALKLIHDSQNIEISVRRHPLNSEDLLTGIPFNVDGSPTVEKFVLQNHAIIMASASVSNLEVLALDRALIRWKHPFEFDLDSLGKWRDAVYNVTSATQIKEAVEQIRTQNPRHTIATVNEIRREYFTPIDEQAMESLINALAGGT